MKLSSSLSLWLVLLASVAPPRGVRGDFLCCVDYWINIGIGDSGVPCGEGDCFGLAEWVRWWEPFCPQFTHEICNDNKSCCRNPGPDGFINTGGGCDLPDDEKDCFELTGMQIEEACYENFVPGLCGNFMGFGGGEPHFMTWSNDWYDYMGACDLVLVTAPDFSNGLGLDIHVRTTVRYDYSYIESAAIRIGEDVVEIGSWGDYFINGVRDAELPALLVHDSVEVSLTVVNEKEKKFEIQVGEEVIVVSAFKDMVSVKVDNASYASFRTSKGLMGTFGTSGETLARNGTAISHKTNPNGFAEDWQVRPSDEGMLFRTVRAPQFPQKCVLPTEKQAVARRLGEHTVTEEEARAACGHWEKNVDACVYDVLATNDLDLAFGTPYAV